MYVNPSKLNSLADLLKYPQHPAPSPFPSLADV
jgi:hypothetical protein